MRKFFQIIPLAVCLLCATPAGAQQVCPGLSYVANTPEDELMQAVAGAEGPQEQIAALDKFSQAHPDSKFMPCVQEYYTLTYLKLNNYDKVIEHGEKGLASNYQDVMLLMNVVKAFVASGKVSDSAFDIIMKAPEQIKAEANPPRPDKVKDDEWKKALEELAEQANEQRGYMEYAFFQLLPRVTDPNKRIQFVDQFVKAYPESADKNAGQINYNYFLVYKMTNQPAKAVEYGEKTIASDANNIVARNLLAYDYAIGRTNLAKAGEYARKVLELAQAMKKPEGVPDDQFKAQVNQQLGMAHLTLGYVHFVEASRNRRVAPAIKEFTVAVDLLEGNPELQAQTLFYLGNAYEFQYPANHQAAVQALTRAVSLQSSWQGQARELLAKIKRAVRQ